MQKKRTKNFTLLKMESQSGVFLQSPDFQLERPSYIILADVSKAYYISPIKGFYLDPRLHHKTLQNIKTSSEIEYFGPFKIQTILPKDKTICCIITSGFLASAITFIENLLLHTKHKIKVVYSAETKKDIAFLQTLSDLQKLERLDISLAIEADQADWTGPIGDIDYLLGQIHKSMTFVLFTSIDKAVEIKKMLPQQVPIFYDAIDLINCGQELCNSCTLFGQKACKSGPIIKLEMENG